jgi:ABC-2 type transport system ATP-binding protein
MSDTILVSAKNLAKNYGKFAALKPCTFDIPAGRIVGVIGSNGAGKSTLLNTMLGLSAYEGDLTVLGRNPFHQRADLMQDVCFIADVATLPRWMTVEQIFDTVEGLHPKFNRAKGEAHLAKTSVMKKSKIRTLSKGMVVQVHLALVLAIDAKLLVLDEPTLGLDIVNRRMFYESILTDYFDETRTILITTHQVEEVEHLLTHAIFVRSGELIVDASLDDLATRYCAVDVPDANAAQAQVLQPIFSRKVFGKTTFVFDQKNAGNIATLGEPRRVGLSDLFVALMSPAAAA